MATLNNEKPKFLIDLFTGNPEQDLAAIGKMLDYLKILQEGRVKPDRNANSGVVYDSLDNLPEIEGIKAKLTEVFDLNPHLIDNLKEEQKQQREERHNNKRFERENRRY